MQDGYLSHGEIVDDLLTNVLTDVEKNKLRKMGADELEHLHITLGRFIRQQYKLYDEENPYTFKNYSPILDASGKYDISPNHPDNFSMSVIRRAWEVLTGRDTVKPVQQAKPDMAKHRKMLDSLRF